MKVAFWAAAGCLGLVAASCSGKERDFSGGHAGAAGQGADAGAPGAGGAPSHAGGTSPDGGQPTAGASGMPTMLPVNGLGEACEDNGALSCNGAAQKLSLLCKGGVWTESTVCESGENCDQATGVCTPILAECEGKIADQLYCGEGDTVFRCGPDLVSTEEVEKCVGKCVASAASGSCAPITCGDGKLQEPEECDDGNDDETDACTNACTDAKCGDGSVWKDHEACDDGNDKSDDDCLATCVSATCGDGFIWAGHETCDDKNKVDTDACTNACQKAVCGDGVLQAGKEECDDKNATSGDGCSKTCTVEPVSLVAAGPYTVCALGSNGQIRCFSGGGAADWEYLSIPLGAGEKATSIASSTNHLCALLSGGKVRCWGANGTGQLGLGDKVTRAYTATSSNVDLGTGAVATSIAAGGGYTVVDGYTCAVLADGGVKCWGDNLYNQLGFVKDANNPAIGDAAGEMGSALVAVPQVAGRLAASVVGGFYNACQVRADKTAFCWGSYARGSYTPQTNLNLGTLLTVSQLSVGYTHACAVLTDNTLKCWGDNFGGALGQGDLEDRDAKAVMGDALLPINLGSGKTAKYVVAGSYNTCAVLNDGAVKCWGYNANGALGKGDKLDVGGAAGDMAALQALDLGAGRKAKQLVMTRGDTNCALLQDGTIACWGNVNTPAPDFLGDEPNEMGSKLPIVSLKF